MSDATHQKTEQDKNQTAKGRSEQDQAAKGQSGKEQQTGHQISDQARLAANRVAASAMEYGQDATQHYVREPARDLLSLVKAYAKDHPDVAACWAFTFGVIVGWKLKP